MFDKLDWCPFCGGDVNVVELGRMYHFYCKTCQYRLCFQAEGENREDQKRALQFWNGPKTEAELERDREAYRITIEGKCAGDEKHCTCVPALRAEVERLQGQLNDISLSLDFFDGAVRVHEGSGPENIAASVAVTLGRLSEKQEQPK